MMFARRRNLFNNAVVTFVVGSAILLCSKKLTTTTSFTPGFQSSSRLLAKTIPATSQTNEYTYSKSTTSTRLNIFKFAKQQQKSVEVDTPTPVEEKSFVTEPGFLVPWIALVVWSFIFAPGELNSPDDTAWIEAIIANPLRPEGVNELAYFLFNLFTVLPVVIAGLVVPNTRALNESASGVAKVLRSSVPYVALTTFIGFFALGPFLVIRPKPYENVATVPFEERSWVTRNILENKLLAYGIVAFTIYLPFGANFVEAYQNDPNGVITGFIDLVQSSRFVSVANVDLLLCHLALTLYVLPIDYKARKPNATNNEIFKIAAAAALLPYLGTAIYMATRPSLPSSRDE